MGLDWAVSAGHLHVNQGPGADALKAFSEAFGVATADEAITLACRGLRAQVEAAGWDITLPSFLKAFGLRVLEAPMTQAGRLDFENGRYVIRIKAAEPRSRGDQEIDPILLRGRQRFSVAHELGHALLLQTLTDCRELLPGLRDPDEWERIESLCDRAAAELLVPMDSFIAGVQRHGVSPESLDGLAQDFAVSREVIFKRFLAGGARTAAIWRVRNIPGKGPISTVCS